MKKCLSKVTEGDGLCLFFIKQIFGAFAGFIIATAWGTGVKFFDLLAKKPICKVNYVSHDSIGYIYRWDISLRDDDSGSMLIYPKEDVVILLDTIKRPNRVTSATEVDLSLDRKNAKGIILNYLDDESKIKIAFETYSSKQLSIKNTKDATCDDLLLDF